MQLRPLRIALGVCVLLIGACDDATEPATPAALTVAGGDAQAGPAGLPLPIPPAVRVLDARGAPVPGVRIEFAITAGGGSVEQPAATSDANGVASAGAWTLGSGTGENTLAASVTGVAPVTFRATARPGSPAELIVLEGDAQAAPVGARLPVLPVIRVLDPFGNPIPGAPVRFAPRDEGGRIGTPITATDEQGIARAGAWTLDTRAGTQSLRVWIEGGPEIDLHATALPDDPVAFELAAPEHQTGIAGEPAAEPPAVIVRDRYGNAVPGTSVRFVVTEGAGSLYGGSTPEPGTDTLVVASDGEGRAGVASWVFGRRTGPQAARATIPDDTVRALFTADALPGPPAAIRIVRGQDQTAQAGTIVAQRPTVLLADAYDNPVPGVPIAFSVATGGGVVNLPDQVTGPSGLASPLSWILGLNEGSQTLVASTPGLPDAVFHANATPGEPFEFEFFFIDTPQDIQDAMRRAAARWQRALVAGQPDADGTIPAGFCGPVEQYGPFDDIRLILLIDSIDGPGGTLAFAGPCAVRSSTRMPAVGGIALDSADIPRLIEAGRLEDVLVHEIGHILGFGTRWGGGLLAGSDGDDPYFTGGAARQAFSDAGGDAYAGVHVPVENTGGPGTRLGHWRESVFMDELMTGFINADGNPLSIVTVASLQDIGYLVDPGAADPWYLAVTGARARGAAPRFPIIDRLWPREPITLDSASR